MKSYIIILSIVLLSANAVYGDDDLSETLPQNIEIPLEPNCEDELSLKSCNKLRALAVRLGLGFEHVTNILNDLLGKYGGRYRVFVQDVVNELWRTYYLNKRGKRGAGPNMNNPFNKFLKKIFDKIEEFVKKTFKKRGTQPKELVTDLKTLIKDDLEELKKSLSRVNNDESTTDFQLDKRGKRGAGPNMNNPFNKFLKKIFDKIGEFVKKTFKKRGTQPKELVTDLKTHIKDNLEELKKSLASVNNDESTTDFQLDAAYTLLNEVYKRSVIDATL